MFERNIIDLVGLFVENVQSLYPFLEDPLGRHCGPGAPAHNMVPATRPTGRCPHSKPKTQEGRASALLTKDENKWGLFQVAPCGFPCLLLPTATRALDTLAKSKNPALYYNQTSHFTRTAYTPFDLQEDLLSPPR